MASLAGKTRSVIVPINLDGWNLEIVAELCGAGLSESDRHDFKAGMADARSVTKLCCAFANSFGGFMILGVGQSSDGTAFEVVGVDAHTEWYGQLVSKIRADPDVAVLPPKVIEVSGPDKAIYVFHIPQSPRRPHLPTPVAERIFWKRQGSSCIQMTLEEIRSQMINYEEKREKLALLLIDLSHKLRSLEEQANFADGSYDGSIFSFDIMDRVVAESFTLLREDVQSIGVLDTLRKRLQLLNAQKQRVFRILSMSYGQEYQNEAVNQYRSLAKSVLPHATGIVEQVERSFREKFGITNPYKAGQ